MSEKTTCHNCATRETCPKATKKQTRYGLNCKFAIKEERSSGRL